MSVDPTNKNRVDGSVAPSEQRERLEWIARAMYLVASRYEKRRSWDEAPEAARSLWLDRAEAFLSDRPVFPDERPATTQARERELRDQLADRDREIERLREAMEIARRSIAPQPAKAKRILTAALAPTPSDQACDHADFHREGAYNVCDECGASTKPEREP